MREGWEYKKLGEVCEIYQPKTLATDQLISDGKYLVYGANGVIGRYNDYNHKEAEILLTCRGATCGTINISAPYSWVNGNAMVIHRKTEEISFEYLKYLMCSLDYSMIITGAAQPQITRQKLAPTCISIPPIPQQRLIVSELDEMNSLIALKREQLKKYDELAQSLFYEMFGDPVENEMGWEVKKLGEVATASIGLTYKPDNVSDKGTIVLRSGNIQDSTISLTDLVRVNVSIPSSKIVKKGDILMCSRNGSFRLVGKVAMINDLPETMSYGAFMTIIRSEYNPYLFGYFKTSAFRECLIQGKTTTVNQITVNMLQNIKLPLPPLPLQQTFAQRIEQIEEQKNQVTAAIAKLETLLASRMQYWFE